jgi:hypothetical protein
MDYARPRLDETGTLHLNLRRLRIDIEPQKRESWLEYSGRTIGSVLARRAARSPRAPVRRAGCGIAMRRASSRVSARQATAATRASAGGWSA